MLRCVGEGIVFVAEIAVWVFIGFAILTVGSVVGGAVSRWLRKHGIYIHDD